jgi:hypothetical protein
VLGILWFPPTELKAILLRKFSGGVGIPLQGFLILFEGVPVLFFSFLVSDKFDGEF